MCGMYCNNHDDFMKNITNQTISYVQDLVDPAVNSKWQMMATDRAAFAETKMAHRKQCRGKEGAALMQATIPDVITLAMPEGGTQAGTSISS